MSRYESQHGYTWRNFHFHLHEIYWFGIFFLRSNGNWVDNKNRHSISEETHAFHHFYFIDRSKKKRTKSQNFMPIVPATQKPSEGNYAKINRTINVGNHAHDNKKSTYF